MGKGIVEISQEQGNTYSIFRKTEKKSIEILK
jgi:hypothetical protein